jgi:hypothetical protein
MSAKRNKRKSFGKTIHITFDQVIEALLDESTPFHPRNLYRFSDIEGTDLQELEQAWPNVSVRRRRAILEDIEELGETNYTLSFEAFCIYTLSDDDPRVRELSVRALWEYDSKFLIPDFMDLLANDPEATVRAAAATALGKYIYLGELEEVPELTLNDIFDQLMQVHNTSDDSLVRRRALESLGFSSREEVISLIAAAFNSGKPEWVVSALFAMGRSANARWSDHVLEMLESDNTEIRYEAIRASGELEIKRALPYLLNLLSEEDSEARLAAVWSLSQIGGEDVQEALEQLYDDTYDEEEAEFIDLALENLQFTEDMEIFDMFEFLPDDEEGKNNGHGGYDREDNYVEEDD